MILVLMYLCTNASVFLTSSSPCIQQTATDISDPGTPLKPLTVLRWPHFFPWYPIINTAVTKANSTIAMFARAVIWRTNLLFLYKHRHLPCNIYINIQYKQFKCSVETQSKREMGKPWGILAARFMGMFLYHSSLAASAMHHGAKRASLAGAGKMAVTGL